MRIFSGRATNACLSKGLSKGDHVALVAASRVDPYRRPRRLHLLDQLHHPQTGHTVKCGPYYAVGIYSHAAALRERGCIEDFIRQGYQRVPE